MNGPELIASGMANKFHGDQAYYTGTHVELHLARVAERVRHLGSKYVIVAWLHDIIEDTDCADENIALVFSGEVVDAVVELTHLPNEPYDDYIDRLCASGNALALQVKKADLEQNISMSHLGGYENMARKKWLPNLGRVLRAINDLEYAA